MFGFRLPTNFNSPYQATSIIDFWRRWHMTLSAFFRDYVYIPLGGNRKGAGMQAAFVLVVFFLTGLWHGAGWTFIVWGSVHGALVLTNHVWRKIVPVSMPALLGWAMTFPAVVTLWVIFRAPSLAVAEKIIAAMWTTGALTSGGIAEINLPYIAFAVPNLILAAALLMPNSTILAHRLRHGRLHAATSPRQGRWWLPAAVTGVALYIAITSIGNMQSKFIYFNF
jgi:D-alanyl-lipoteichoic acid acyltransferase DltB (MBOAT superfamily)